MSLGLYDENGNYIPLSGRQGIVDDKLADTSNMVSAAAILEAISKTNVINTVLNKKSIQMVSNAVIAEALNKKGGVYSLKTRYGYENGNIEELAPNEIANLVTALLINNSGTFRGYIEGYNYNSYEAFETNGYTSLILPGDRYGKTGQDTYVYVCWGRFSMQDRENLGYTSNSSQNQIVFPTSMVVSPVVIATPFTGSANGVYQTVISVPYSTPTYFCYSTHGTEPLLGMNAVGSDLAQYIAVSVYSISY